MNDINNLAVDSNDEPMNEDELQVGAWLSDRLGVEPVRDEKVRYTMALLGAAYCGAVDGGLAVCWGMHSDSLSEVRITLLMALQAGAFRGFDAVELTAQQARGGLWLALGSVECPLWALGQDLPELDRLGLADTVGYLVKSLARCGHEVPEQWHACWDARLRELERVEYWAA